jgi:hypothetical protein
MNKNKKFFWIFFPLLFLILTASGFCLAEDRKLEIQYPVIGDQTVPAYVTTLLPDYIKYIFYLAISIAGLLAFGALIYGGVRWLTSAGNPASMSDAKDQIFAGILGLIILLASWLFLNTLNPQLVVLKNPEIAAIPSPSPLPPLHEGDVCFYDKQYNVSDKKVVACYSRGDQENGGSSNFEGMGIVQSIEIKRGEDAVAVFEGPNYSGRRVCFKGGVTTDGCGPDDLTKCSFGIGVSDLVIFNDLTDDIRSINVFPSEKCALPGITLPQGPKNDFSASVIAYRDKNFKGPAVLTFYGTEDQDSSTTGIGFVRSIEIKNSSSAVRLFDKENFDGKTICFRDSVQDLSSYAHTSIFGIKIIGWDIRVRSFKVIYDSECPNPEITQNVEDID